MVLVGDQIYKLEGDTPGPSVAIIGLIHGDEEGGGMVIDFLKNHLKVKAGTVYLIYGNPAAYRQKKRYIHTNLGRLFSRDIKPEFTYEYQRAQVIMDILDQCDASLDLHTYYEPDGDSTPFAICEPHTSDIIKHFDIPIVVHNYADIGSTDVYMMNQGKPGVFVELGATEKPEPAFHRGMQCAYQFLQYFGCIDPVLPKKSGIPSVFHKVYEYAKETEHFVFSKIYRTFDSVVKGELIATDAGKEIRAEHDGKIMFPRTFYPVGVPSFFIITPQT